MPDYGALQGSYYGQFLRRYFGVTDPEGASVPPELLQAFVLENDRPEYSFITGEKRCVGSHTAAAVAAQASFVQIINANITTQSRMMLVVDEVACDDGAADVFTLSFDAGPVGSLVVEGSPADTRWGTPLLGTVTAAMRDGANAAAFGQQVQVRRSSSAESVVFRGPFILAPGHGLHVQGQALNVTFRASFRWRERPMRDGER